MVAEESAVDPLHAVFVDVDNRLRPITNSLTSCDLPLSLWRVDSLSAAASLVETEPVDCVVVLDAPATGDKPSIDGIERAEVARDRLTSVPVAVYSLDCTHAQLQRALDAEVPVVAATPDRPELVYRQLRNAAGMEQHFQSDSDLLASLLDYYPHHIFLKDETGRFEAVSEATAREYGLSRTEMVGLTDYEVLDPQTAHETYQEERALLERREPTINRVDHWIDGKGRDRWMSITKAPRYDSRGDPVGIVGSSRDVTDSRRKEQMVRELHEASRELVRAESPTDIGWAAMSLTEDIPVLSHIQVVLTDESSGALGPLSADRDVGRSLYERYERWFVRAVETGDPQYVTTDGTAVDKPSQASDLEAAILPLSEHGALGLAADADTFTDFGIDLANILASNLEAALDRAERERELERQNERLEEFASIVSHDLRNPLNVASAATELVAEETDSENVDRIRDALERMEQLIEALLTLARKGKVVGEPELVEIEATAREAWEVVDTPEADLRIAGSGVTAADPNRLVELFENLFRNAIEHGGTDVTVTVGVRETGDGFYVADDGSGIGPSAREQLFEMGYSDADDGTGYGLYIVSTIADAHGWSISAGESADGGARFDVTGAAIKREHGSRP